MKRVLLTLLILLFTVGGASAGSQVGLRGAGFSVAFVDPDGADTSIGIGVFADLGHLTNNIVLEPYFGYWSNSEDFFDGSEISIRDAILGARGKYEFAVSGSSLRPFAGAGLGLHFARAEVSIPDFGFGPQYYEDSDTKLGFDLGGGVSAPLNSFELRGEIWYSAVDDLSQVALRFGIMWPFGGPVTATP